MRAHRRDATCIFLVFLVLAVPSLSPVSYSATLSAQLKKRGIECQRKWETLFKRLKHNMPALESAWSRVEGECRDTGSYEFHQSAVLADLGRYHDSIQVLSSALKEKLPDQKALRVAYLSERFSEALLSHSPAQERNLYHVLAEFVRQHPHDPYALTEQARQLTTLHHYKRAVTSAKAAVEFDPGSPAARYWLVIAAARIGMCHTAERYIVPAIVLRHALLAHKSFMYSAATCYGELGNFKAAKFVLIDLAERNPAVKTDPVFKRLARLVLHFENLSTKSASPPSGN